MTNGIDLQRTALPFPEYGQPGYVEAMEKIGMVKRYTREEIHAICPTWRMEQVLTEAAAKRKAFYAPIWWRPPTL